MWNFFCWRRKEGLNSQWRMDRDRPYPHPPQGCCPPQHPACPLGLQPAPAPKHACHACLLLPSSPFPSCCCCCPRACWNHPNTATWERQIAGWNKVVDGHSPYLSPSPLCFSSIRSLPTDDDDDSGDGDGGDGDFLSPWRETYLLSETVLLFGDHSHLLLLPCLPT